MAGVVGKCRLCLVPDAALRESHILSRWAHQRARGEGNEEPVHVHEGRAFQRSGHLKERLLCDDCEQRIGKVEDRVSKFAARADGTTPVLDLLGNALWASDDGIRLVLPGRVDTDALCYFGASILWRASVANTIENCNLGSEYEERFRKYLLGASPFPEDTACLIQAHDEPTADEVYLGAVLTAPATEHLDGHDGHRFLVGGFLFQFFTGPSLPEEVKLYGASSHSPFLLLARQRTTRTWLDPYVCVPPYGKLAKRPRLQAPDPSSTP